MKEEKYLRFLQWCLEAPFKGDITDIPCAEDIDWQDLLTFARKQTIVGLYWQGIQRLPADCPNKPSEDDVMDWIGECTKIKRRNVKTDNAVLKLCHLLDGENIGYFIFKGQAVSRYYPEPEVRISGDVDFYVCRKDWEKAIGVISKVAKITDRYSFRHLDFSMDGVPFEMHYHTALFPTHNKQEYWDNMIDEYFDDVLDHVDIRGTSVPTLSPTVNAIYLFIHTYHHFLKEGIALRQFIDWMMFFKAKHGEIVKAELDAKLDRLGLKRAFKAFGAILVDVLGMSSTYFPYDLTDSDRKYESAIMEIVLKYGNFGKYGRNEQRAGWTHSIETGMRSLRHTFKFFWLSPTENLLWVPQLIRRSLRKNWRSTPALLKKEGEVQSES